MSKSLFNVIQNIRYRIYIVDVGRSDTDINNNVVFAVYRAVFAVVETVRFPFFVQLSTFRIVFALLNLSCWRFVVIFLVKRLLTQCFSLLRAFGVSVIPTLSLLHSHAAQQKTSGAMAA